MTTRTRAGVRIPCLYCRQLLSWDQRTGWTHPEGGGYMQRCPECGWTGAPFPSRARCPGCGSPELRDDHCAQPDYGTLG